ncbi:MAG TPA: NAD(P)/FAD-dependent oxidoreductase [Pseudolysinimonas sp.]|jgi:cation diffusion facilitator CzcD-associated flavoprotein CzcO
MTRDDRTVDVLVIGAGIGGLYAVHRFRQAGLSVIALEAAADVGGVWYHNSYPGARVDLESETFCYLFDDELYREWKWSERYAAQPEIHAYLRHVAERFDLRKDIRFETRVTGLRWIEEDAAYLVSTETGDEYRAHFVVAASGQLSARRSPSFEGLEDFRGDWYQTSNWPKQPVDLRGKRVGVIGTGSSGVQVITAIADEVGELVVFQRTPNYSVPAHNHARNRVRHEYVGNRREILRDAVFGSPMGFLMPPDAGPATNWSPIEREQLLEQRWANGGQALLRTFSDQGVDWDSNTVVGDFVRERIRERLDAREDLTALIPNRYPIGTRRLCVDTGYYEKYLRDNVQLVDLSNTSIERFTETGIELADGRRIELDVAVFALGFEAFTGTLFQMDIVGRNGVRLEDAWAQGPETMLGLMAHDFPNLFLPTGPGGPSVLANMFAANVQGMDLVADVISQVRNRGKQVVWPETEPQRAWTEHVQGVARGLIRYQVDNYFVHHNADGSKVYLPYTGGFATYVDYCQAELDAGLPSFAMA